MKDDIIVKWLGEWSGEVGFGAAALRLFLAVFCASVLGFERASKRHSAGLRTFILVTTTSAAAAFMDLIINADNRVFIPILSFASVLCAIATSVKSVLFSAKSQIKGLTTSAGADSERLSRLVHRRGVLFAVFTDIRRTARGSGVVSENRNIS